MTTAATYKNIPSRKKWAEDRDKAGGKSGLCKKVNVGKLLDEFEKAGGDMKKRAAALEGLKTGLIHYTADAAVKKLNDLHKTAMSLLKVVESEMLAAKQSKDVGLAIGLKIGDGYKRIQKITAAIAKGEIENAGLDYERFWDGIGRGVGQQLHAGTLRDDWLKVHAAQPDRTAIGNERDLAKRKTLVENGLKAYKAALEKLLSDAQAQGLDVKLS